MLVGLAAIPAQGMSPRAPDASAAASVQTITTADYTTAAKRDLFHVTTVQLAPASIAAPPAVGTPDPGTAKALGLQLMLAKGWQKSEFSCLSALWDRESHWNVHAGNPVSGAYGIPQALPGNKMASAGPDWRNSAKTQILWGLGYIRARYGSPCAAWAHSQKSGWY